MSDDTRPQLLMPDPAKRIVSVAESKRIADENRKYGPGGKRVRPPGDIMQDAMTRSEAMDKLGGAALAVGEKVYEQLAAESQQFLQEMEMALKQEIHNEFERRSLRGRLRALWRRFFPVPTPELVVDAVDVLDPNVHAAAAEPALVVREFAKFDEDGMAFLDAGGVALLRHRSGDWHLVAKETATLRRVHALLNGEGELEDGMTSLVLPDSRALADARALCQA